MGKANRGNEKLAFNFLQVPSRRVEEGDSRSSQHQTTDDDFLIWFAFNYCLLLVFSVTPFKIKIKTVQ